MAGIFKVEEEIFVKLKLYGNNIIKLMRQIPKLFTWNIFITLSLYRKEKKIITRKKKDKLKNKFKLKT